MKKIIIGLITVSLIILLPVVRYAKPEVKPPVKPTEWHFDHITIPGTTYQQLTNVELPKRIEQATGGRLKISMLPNIVKPTEVLKALAEKKLDGAVCILQYHDAEFPQFGIANVPFMFDDLEEYFAKAEKLGLLASSNEVIQNRSNAILLGYGSYTEQIFWTKKTNS